MSNLIPMDEAARILGMTVEQVSELRAENEIFGYKDGATWKFKMSELERVADERGLNLNMSEASKVASDLSESFGFDLSESSGLLMDDDSSAGGLIEDLDSAEYIEDSSVELAQPESPAKPPAAINLDKDSGAINLDDSDLRLADSGLLMDNSSDTAKSAAASDSDSKSVLDDDEGELSFGSSSLNLASDSRKLTEEDENKAASKSSVKASDSSLLLSGDDDLLLADDGDDFTFGDDSGSLEESSGMGSDFEDSGSLILDDSDSSQEIKLEANESGINLAASSSGISLGESGELDLGASDIDGLSFSSGDDDEIVMLDDEDDAPVLLEEDDFNLTPLDSSLEEDDTSGSQVIALEDSEIYADDSAATMLGDDSFEAAPMGAGFDDGFGGGVGSSFDEGFGDDGVMPATGVVGVGADGMLEEAPYSIAQIVSLGGILFLMLTGGMVAYNLAQNLWLPSDQVVGDSVLTFFLKMVGADKS